MTAGDASESLKGLRNMMKYLFCSLSSYAFFSPDCFVEGKAVVYEGLG